MFEATNWVVTHYGSNRKLIQSVKPLPLSGLLGGGPVGTGVEDLLVEGQPFSVKFGEMNNYG